MSIDRKSLLVGIFMLFCSLCVVSTTATACPLDVSVEGGLTNGVWLFQSPTGSSITRTVTVNYGDFDDITVSIAGSDAFTIGPYIKNGAGGTFTVTFHPGPNAGGTLKSVMTIKCPACTITGNLEGTTPTADVGNTLTNDVSISVAPNPATDHVNILASGARKAEIRIYDLLGKEFGSSFATEWELNAASIPPGSYIVRVAGESISGEAFVASKRIVIAR
jgi:hypothetical protein